MEEPIIIIYDSQYGNTRDVAQHIFETAREQHEAYLLHVNEVTDETLSAAGSIIIGSPTHAGRCTPSVKQILGRLPASTPTAVFDTSCCAEEEESRFGRFIIRSFGNASRRMERTLNARGIQITARETFYVQGTEGPLLEGELERSALWAAKVFRQD